VAISRSELEELAREPIESVGALGARLSELRSRGAELLQCIIYVRLNQGCSLGQATDTVINSSAWADQKDAFLRHQQEMFEEFLASNRENIESITQTMTPDRTETVVHMKTPASPGEKPA
jgi:hypothetical protein